VSGGEDLAEGQPVTVVMSGHAWTYLPDGAAAGPTVGEPILMAPEGSGDE
jgi:hypothetical protein